MIIKARNTLADPPYAEKTFMTNQEVAGTNVIRWANPDIFNASWAMQIGETGENQTEVVLLSASTPAGTAGTLTANTLYEHPTNTPLYAIRFDQIVFERSTTGTTGVATPMSGGTVTIQANSLYTTFDDPTGSSSYAYRTYFKNSIGIVGSTSTESDWITSSGFSFFSLGAMRQRVKDKVWNAQYLTDPMIDNWLNEWQDIMTNAVIQLNQDYNLGTAQYAFPSGGASPGEALGTITATDFKQVRRVWITYDGQSFYKSTKMESNDFGPAQTFNSTHPYHYMQGNTVFGVKPSDAGTAQIEYYKTTPQLVNDTDTLPTPMQPYTDSFVNYAIAQASFKDGKTPEYQARMAEANASKAMFVAESAPRDKTGPTYINVVENISGEDSWWF